MTDPISSVGLFKLKIRTFDPPSTICLYRSASTYLPGEMMVFSLRHVQYLVFAVTSILARRRPPRGQTTDQIPSSILEYSTPIIYSEQTPDQRPSTRLEYSTLIMYSEQSPDDRSSSRFEYSTPILNSELTSQSVPFPNHHSHVHPVTTNMQDTSHTAMNLYPSKASRELELSTLNIIDTQSMFTLFQNKASEFSSTFYLISSMEHSVLPSISSPSTVTEYQCRSISECSSHFHSGFLGQTQKNVGDSILERSITLLTSYQTFKPSSTISRPFITSTINHPNTTLSVLPATLHHPHTRLSMPPSTIGTETKSAFSGNPHLPSHTNIGSTPMYSTKLMPSSMQLTATQINPTKMPISSLRLKTTSIHATKTVMAPVQPTERPTSIGKDQEDQDDMDPQEKGDAVNTVRAGSLSTVCISMLVQGLLVLV